MTRRFWVGAALALPLLVWRWATSCSGSASAARSRAGSAHWLQLALATPVVLWGGWPFFVRGWASLAQAAARTCSR